MPGVWGPVEVLCSSVRGENLEEGHTIPHTTYRFASIHRQMTVQSAPALLGVAFPKLLAQIPHLLLFSLPRSKQQPPSRLLLLVGAGLLVYHLIIQQPTPAHPSPPYAVHPVGVHWYAGLRPTHAHRRSAAPSISPSPRPKVQRQPRQDAGRHPYNTRKIRRSRNWITGDGGQEG